MKIRIVSDLHLDFEPLEPKYYGEDLLILAGDISNYYQDTFNYINKFLTLDEKVKVLLVLGNHDYYHSSIDGTIWYWENVDINRLIFLHDNSKRINGIRFFGTTLWTDMNKSNNKDMEFNYNHLKDFVYIEDRFTPTNFVKLHANSLKKLKMILNTSKEPVVVVTHHLPSRKCIQEDHITNPCNASFASDLDHVIDKNKVKMWIHGHTHASNNFKINDVSVICNPRGYKDENKDFKYDYIIEI